MTFSYTQTKVLIELILKVKPQDARAVLRYELNVLKSREPEFYIGIIKHGPGMSFTSTQWFDLLSKIPTHVLRGERQLMQKLSQSQAEKLPPATLG
jgi:hypothetical protein